MGPRPFGRGRCRIVHRARGPARRFNGAATFRSRKGPPPRPNSTRRPASMGPRPFGRGRRRQGRAVRRRCRLQWGRDLSVAEGTSRATAAAITVCFNGAATFRSRKVRAKHGGALPPCRLQWGRDLSVAEGRWPAYATPSQLPRFNGAATFRSRKGPGTTPSSTLVPLLQWGRDLSVAEGSAGKRPSSGRRCGFNGAATFRSRKVRPTPRAATSVEPASMGPRPFGRGRLAARSSDATTRRASMGPRPFGRGRPIATAISSSANDKLQWGRDLSVAEG